MQNIKIKDTRRQRHRTITDRMERKAQERTRTGHKKEDYFCTSS